MGDSLSGIMSISTAPPQHKATLWKHCVGDMLEKVKAGQTQPFGQPQQHGHYKQ